MSGLHSRRELVAETVALVLPPGDRKHLADLLEAEHLAIDVYGRAADTARISSGARALARRLRAQERAHAAALVRQLGGSATAQDEGASGRRQPAAGRLGSVNGTEAALARHGIDVELANLRTERDWFTLLERLEAALEGAYYKSLRHLADVDAAALAARIMANEAQHSTLLFRFRHPHDIQLDVAVGLVRGSGANH